MEESYKNKNFEDETLEGLYGSLMQRSPLHVAQIHVVNRQYKALKNVVSCCYVVSDQHSLPETAFLQTLCLETGVTVTVTITECDVTITLT